MSPSLRALMERSIDYAGMFPPAGLHRAESERNYRSYRDSKHAWILARLVVPAADVDAVPADLHPSLSVLATENESRAGALETKAVVESAKPTYCEVPIDQLDTVKVAGNFAKIRTGGVTATAIPSIVSVAAFITSCAMRKLPFKATAGLHHAIRGEYALTYAADAPRGTMHGFLNVLLAAAFAWYGVADPAAILAETDPGTFRFDDCVHWRQHSLDAAAIAVARRDFIHSFGSCSFVEPIQELQQLGLL